MQPIECPFESEVLAAVMEGRWPQAAETHLRDHASCCSICADTALVVGAIGNARREARENIIVPDSTRVWWTAQLRSRREDVQTASRPITAAQSIAGACAVGLLGACFGATSAWFQNVLKWAGASIASVDVTLAVGMGAVLFLIPAAAWLALRRE